MPAAQGIWIRETGDGVGVDGLGFGFGDVGAVVNVEGWTGGGHVERSNVEGDVR